ncbi:MAG TPA: tetratricopeptide repeat protein [Allosphingosinicella sp.]|jgi:TolA-binding protein
MRFHLLGLVLLASAAMPAAAQEQRVERRVDRLEQEMRAVQRRVFPGANGSYVGPEIGNEVRTADPSGVPSSSAVADLTARVDALESQLASLTGQIEQNANRIRQLENAFASARDASNARLDALERSPAPAAEPVAEDEPAEPRRPAVTSGSTPPAASGASDAEAAYNEGFRLWEQKKYAEAQKVLEDVSKRHPDSRWASWAGNLAGRAYLDGGKPATAAKVLLGNYQANPRGERAADSLYFLGQALVALKKPADACKAYDELQDVYGDGMRDYLKQRLPAARTAAKCK